MKYSTFLEILEKLQENDNKIIAIHDLGIDLCNFNIPLDQIITLLLKEIYTENGVDWIYWFIFDNKMGERKLEAKDEVGNLICHNPKSLFEYIEKFHKR